MVYPLISPLGVSYWSPPRGVLVAISDFNQTVEITVPFRSRFSYLRPTFGQPFLHRYRPRGTPSTSPRIPRGTRRGTHTSPLAFRIRKLRYRPVFPFGAVFPYPFAVLLRFSSSLPYREHYLSSPFGHLDVKVSDSPSPHRTEHPSRTSSRAPTPPTKEPRTTDNSGSNLAGRSYYPPYLSAPSDYRDGRTPPEPKPDQQPRAG